MSHYKVKEPPIDIGRQRRANPPSHCGVTGNYITDFVVFNCGQSQLCSPGQHKVFH